MALNCHPRLRIVPPFVRLLTAALVVLALASGCWPFPQDGTTTPTGTPQTRATPSEAGVEAEATLIPGDADALDIAGQTEDPPTLDPALALDTYSHFIIHQLFSGLVAFDDDLNIVPDIAAAMPSVSSDGKTYTFVLRKDVQFPDGQKVTAADFKYSIERAADPKLAGSQPPSALPAGLYLSDIVGVKEKLEGKAQEVEGVKALDPYTLEITLTGKKAFFLSKLTAGPSFVVQRSNVESGADWTEKPRGTGPFRLEKWVHHQQMVLVANPDYYGGQPLLPRINIWMGANATGELQQYEMGGLDVAYVPVYDLERVSDRNSLMHAELQTVPSLEVTYLGFNLRHKPFEDPKIREALARVIDRQKIARVMLQSRVRQANGFVPPNMAGYEPREVDTGYNVTRARQLIAESTYKDAKNLPRMRMYTSGSQLGTMLRDVFSQTLGIDLELRDVEWSDYVAGLDRGDYPMFALGWVADHPDPEAILGSLFRSNSPGNYSGYRNADVDAALNAAAEESNTEKRMVTYAQVEARILMDYPAVPLFHPVSYTLVKPHVRNLKVTPLGILSLKNVRLVDR